MKPYMAETMYECLRALRAPSFAIPTLALPIVFYLFFGVVLAEGDRAPAIDRFIFVGCTVMGVMGPGLFAFGVFVATERAQGLFTLKRALPVPPLACFVAKLVLAVLFAAVVTLGVILAATLTEKVTLTLGETVSFAAVTTFGAVPFCALGLLIGSWASGRSAPAVVNVCFLPMIYLSGILIPLPASFASIKLASPAYHLDQLALTALGVPSPMGALAHGIILLGMTSVFLSLSMWRFSHEA
jgi:ABC-2 type transport system permease protein